MRHAETADVVIVGARAAGAATALLLARHGLRVVVVDRAREGCDTLSTHALMRGGVVQLRRWGVLDDLIDAGTPPIRETVFHYADETVWLPIKPGAGVDALYAPRRTVLDPLLVAAARRAGADVRFGCALTALTCDDEGRVDGVRVRDRAGTLYTIGARFVVGADGRESTTARLVGAELTHWMRATTVCSYAYYAGLPARGYEWAYRTSGMAGLIPTNDEATCVFVAQRPGQLGRGRQGLLDALDAASADLAGRVREAVPVSPVRTFVGRSGHLRQAWGPGWALVGDAGSWKDPISAHGLTDALRDAELLARAIVRGAGGSDEAAELTAYAATRDELTLPILRGSAAIAAMEWDDDGIKVLLRALNLAMSEELRVIEALDAQTPVASATG